MPRAVDVIRRKRDGQELSREEIAAFVSGACGEWPDYQLTAFLMAAWLRGLTDAETAALTAAMTESGERIDLSDLPGPKIDKHSTGGVGDKTSLILAPLAAACGVVVPMMSGRGLGHSGGTLDKLESITGFRVNLTTDEFRAILSEVGAAMIGQTARVAPADRKLYALRDVTATVESVPLITASILSKKLAEGINGLIMDVKVGNGAFMKTPADARRLAESLVRVARASGLKCEALLTAMDAPLGRAVGNAREVAECIEVLRGQGPADLIDLSVILAARMVRLGGQASTMQEAEAKVRAALSSGRGLEVFRRLVERQGGDPRMIDEPARLPAAPHRTTVDAPRAGFLSGLLAEPIGRAAVILGAGRDRADDPVDPAVGVVLLRKPGDTVTAGEPILDVHYRDAARLGPALELMRSAIQITDAAPPEEPLVRETIDEH